MIGNDIVDLSISKVGEGSRRIRFMTKIFTDEEIDLIQSSKHEDLMIWLMWSIKESVYKIVARKEKRIRYAPKSIHCQSVMSLSNTSYQSTVIYDGQIFHSISNINDDCIHTIAFDDQVSNTEIQFSCFDNTNKKNQNLSLDNLVVDALNNSQDNLNSQITIQRDEIRIPHVYHNDNEVGILSMSQHGRYEGYAYLNISS